MAIRTIPNQAINLQISEPENCSCSQKEYCQMINKNDQTKFQINSDNLVLNADFSQGFSHWNLASEINISVDITNESSAGACDGKFIINATAMHLSYSIDGISFQDSNEFDNLCDGCHTIIAKQPSGSKGFVYACIDTNIDCGIYTDAYLFDLENINLSKTLNCYLHDVL